MKCPNCGHFYASSQQRWQEKAIARGWCIQCGDPLDATRDHHADGRPMLRCRRCRLKVYAQKERRRLAKAGAGLSGS